jgi:hypothetical protein
VVEYADDVTNFVTSPADIYIIGDILTYEMATGAHLNIRKSKAMTAGLWDKSTNMLIIPCYLEITVVVFRFTIAVIRSGNFTCLWKAERGQDPGERRLGLVPTYETMKTVCAYHFILQDIT